VERQTGNGYVISLTFLFKESTLKGCESGQNYIIPHRVVKCSFQNCFSSFRHAIFKGLSNKLTFVAICV
jgi:hypothetical protein